MIDYLYIWVLCLLTAGLFLYEEHEKKYGSAVILKGLASLFFVLLGHLSSNMTQDSQIPPYVLAGLFLGVIADVLLNLRFVFTEAGKKIFLVGILVFLSGHVMYIIALIPKCSSLLNCVVVASFLTALLIWWIFQRITAKPAFKVFGVFYLGTIMIMNTIAFSILLSSPSSFSTIFAFGAGMFLASDIVLILNTFGSEQKETMRITNIILYYIGQLSIASSLQLL